jgi:epsin
VRNRASEISTLLSDIEKIRQERRKAKSNKTKYGGQGNDGGMSFVTPTGSKYGGFGSESVLGGGGGGGGGSAGASYRGGGDYDSSGDGEFNRLD